MASDCQLTAGIEQDPPFHFTQGQQEIIGIDAEILKLVGQQIGCTIHFVERPWVRTIAELKSGSLDIAIGASMKEERTHFAYYSPPYRGHPHVLFLKRDRSFSAASLESFLKQGQKLGIVRGWHYTNELRKLLDAPVYAKNIVVISRFELLLKMLDKQRLDGFLGNPSVAASVFGISNLEDRYTLVKADMDKLHFILSKKSVSKELSERFNNALTNLLEQGTFQSKCQKYRHHLKTNCSLLGIFN